LSAININHLFGNYSKIFLTLIF